MGTVGGYALTALATVCVARFLPIGTAEATVLATFMCFLIYAIVIVLAFSLHSVRKLALWMAIAAALMTLALALTFAMGPRP